MRTPLSMICSFRPLYALFLGLTCNAFTFNAHAGVNELRPAEKSAGWKLLFDGRSLDGWRAAENPGTFSVEDGAIVVHGPRAHLFYIGEIEAHDFVNFELSLDVRTRPQANSGVYFHTRFQERGWPEDGHEVQVNNSHSDPSRTAGLYDVEPNLAAVAQDDRWFTLTIRVEGRHVVTCVDGRTITDYTEPADWQVPANHIARRISRGTFALQGHDPESEVRYRNLKVRALPSAIAPLPALQVSENRRFLVTADGAPFFWLGDTAWELIHRITREEADLYLRRRAAQGFNVIQTVVLAELNGLRDPNAYGQLPLQDADPTKPREDYFQHVDWVIDRAAAYGLYVALLPTWGDKWNNRRENGEPWGAGPAVFTPENARTYGEYLGKRYAQRTNLIWVLGGDRPADTPELQAIARTMAEGIRRTDTGRHLLTFHPNGGRGSAEMLPREEWIDFHMRQNGHYPDFLPKYAPTREDYDRTPVKPVIDAEALYEDHPLAFRAADFGHSTASDVRRTLYWDLFSGAFGYTYGHHSVWQMYAEGRKPVNHPLMPWAEALTQPGARQMQHARRLLESRPFLTRVPADTMLVPARVATSVPGQGRGRFVATKDAAGRYAMIYVPVGGREFAVNLEELSGERIRAWWFNPRDGSATVAGEFPKTGTPFFSSPTPGDDSDWVLVLDDAAQNYPAPGTSRLLR